MNTEITITAEQLIQTALKIAVVEPDAPDLLLSRAIVDLHLQTEPETIARQSLVNSIANGLKRQERQAAAAHDRFDTVGQMSLFGDLIPEHQIPRGWQSKMAAEVDAWMANRADIERQNADELRKAADAQEQKARKFEAFAAATHRVVEALIQAGLDPHQVTYEQAIAHAEAFHGRGSPAAGATTRRPVR